ncbi:MAG: hypothetical protein OEM03_08640 [Chromatiales bacterium]|nr:hypothetical protein [Chromatiales bacterium]
MKYKLLVMLAMAMLAGPLHGADSQSDQAQLKEAEAEMSLKEAEVERSLEDARRRLEEAAAKWLS